MTARASVATVLALLSTLVFARSTFREFDRVRITLSEPHVSPTGTEISFDVPDLSALDDNPLVVLIDAESHDHATQTFTIRFDETSLGEFRISARHARMVAIIPESQHSGDRHALRVSAETHGWTVRRAQISNVRGFSNGLINTVVVPEAAAFDHPPVVSAVVVMIAAAVAVWRTRVWRSSLGGRIDAAVAALTAMVLVTVVAAPFVSRFRILVAFHTWLALTALLCLPAIERVAREMPKLPLPTAAKWFAILLAVLAATSVPRWVGDGQEYLSMASAFRSGRWPEIDAGHFWLYSAVATPFVTMTDAMMFGEAAGFALLNGLLLTWACAVAAGRSSSVVIALVFVGPIIWWLDKVHAEVFLFSLLALSIAWLDDKPGRSLLALGAAAAQNPSIAPLLPLAAVMQVRRQSIRNEASFWMCAAAGGALALLNPLYYLVRAGRLFPLLPDNKPAWPAPAEFVAFLIDPNIGLITNVPLLALAGLVAVWSARRSFIARRQMFALVAAVMLLFAFTQATNVNHGGTPGMSRYALWLIPLMIPVLEERGTQRHAPGRRVLLTVSMISAVWCLVVFHPARRESFLNPTPLAALLWTRYPGATNPVPEIFIERLQHHERSWTIPIATESCEKALIGSPDGRDPTWPAQCRPSRAPDACRRPGAVCYANRIDDGFSFVPVTYWPYPRKAESR
jgi:hypothetical protein